jgi:acetyl-CoA carboxylase carboxyltransferase component
VRLAMKKQLEAIEAPDAREQTFQSLVAVAYERGRALNMAQLLELDSVIDPADTRAYLARGLESVPPPAPRRRFIDTW